MSTTAAVAVDAKTLADTAVVSPQKTAAEIAADRKSLEADVISNLMKDLSEAEKTGYLEYSTYLQWDDEGKYADIAEKHFRLAIDEINKRPKIVTVQFIAATVNDERAAYLAENLNGSVTSINLYSNPITDKGVKALAKRKSTKTLSVNYWTHSAHITDEGIKALSESTTLTELSISGEHLTPTAGIYLAANKSILKLDFSHSITGTNPKTTAEQTESNDLFIINLSFNTTLKEFYAPYEDLSNTAILSLARMDNLELMDIRSDSPPTSKVKMDIVELRKARGLLTAFPDFCRSEVRAENAGNKPKTLRIFS